MTLFLEKLSKEYAPENLTLVMDGAGWHHSKKLLIPQNIKIVLRPPYSPVLNPVERFWLQVKRATIKNKVWRKPLATRGCRVLFSLHNFTSGYRQNMRHKLVQLIMEFSIPATNSTLPTKILTLCNGLTLVSFSNIFSPGRYWVPLHPSGIGFSVTCAVCLKK